MTVNNKEMENKMKDWTAIFLKNQGDLLLDNAKVIWTGQTVCLHKVTPQGNVGAVLTVLTADARIVQKIQTWCAKNSYRCEQIQNGRVML